MDIKKRSRAHSSGSDSDSSRKRDKKKQKKKQSKHQFGYSDSVNPFGDANLSTKFVWKKKEEKERAKRRVVGEAHSSDSEDEEQREIRKRERVAEEILKMKQRRQQKELEKQKWEEEKEKLLREREARSWDEWEEKEEEFHLQQAKLASEIRIKEGRARPIDLISKNLSLFDVVNGSKKMSTEELRDYDIEMREPYRIFQGLDLQQLNEFQKDIQIHLKLDTTNRTFWQFMMTVCEDEIKKSNGTHETGIHPSVREDVEKMFAGKPFQELVNLEAHIKSMIENPDGTIDVEYWESLHKQLQLYKARAYLREKHKVILDIYLQLLTNHGIDMKKEKQHGELKEKPSSSSASSASSSTTSTTAPEEEVMRRQQEEMLEEDEELFTDEIQLESKPYSWDDKYRPRKPKYFNRVHTGYEWNKYNQTHYDVDNPPPKVIQGYKFNIFYPDLIDKSKTPTYFVEPDGVSKDTVIIRFHAGPPYEDIAFKILNKEWEKSHRKGFKNTFERGVLHVWFNFKRFKYRR